MPAAYYDIIIEQGATFTKQFIWKDSEGTPVDITGYTARMQVRRNKSATDIYLTATTENGYITLGDSLGTVDIEVPADITEDLTFVRGVYDLELIDSEGVVTRLVEGGVQLSKEVTR